MFFFLSLSFALQGHRKYVMLAAVLCRVRLGTAIAIFVNCKCDILVYTNFIKSNIKLLLSLNWNFEVLYNTFKQTYM